MTPTALRSDSTDLSDIAASGVAHLTAAATDADEWSRLWFALERHGWGALALVPAAPGTSSRQLADRLANAARAYDAGSVEVFDAEHVAPEHVQTAVAAVRADTAAGTRVLMVLPSPLVRAPAIPLSRTADAALLVVSLEQSSVKDARRTVAAIGAPHFLGSVTVSAR